MIAAKLTKYILALDLIYTKRDRRFELKKLINIKYANEEKKVTKRKAKEKIKLILSNKVNENEFFNCKKP